MHESHKHLIIHGPCKLAGTVRLKGAKNAILVIMASLILTKGRSCLQNVPALRDVYQMIALLKALGAEITFDAPEGVLTVDTTTLHSYEASSEIMKQMRASILVMGPLLVRMGKARLGMPGGCSLGARPIDYHLKAFQKMGAAITMEEEFLTVTAQRLQPCRFMLDYPSVGATENIMMAATLTPGVTYIVNAALEPEVFDLIAVLKKMGAQISLEVPATIRIEGVAALQPIEHTVMNDRLEAGTLLLAAAVTGGSISIYNAPVESMELLLQKLAEMGHQVTVDGDNTVHFKATDKPQAVSFKTMPYPGFPTDLQAPMLAALCLADGVSVITETVFENRMLHCTELTKMGAHIMVHGSTATVTGIKQLQGTEVVATDIRASAALVLAALAAEGTTVITNIHHLLRGYDGLDQKLRDLGAAITFHPQDQ